MRRAGGHHHSNRDLLTGRMFPTALCSSPVLSSRRSAATSTFDLARREEASVPHMRSVSRREFLVNSGAAFSGVVLTRSGNPLPSKATGVRFGVRTPFPEGGLRERALLLEKLGYEGIELGHEWLDQSLQSIQEQLKGTPIAVSAIVGSIKLLDTDPQVRAQAVELDRKRLEVAQALGAGGLIEVPTFGPNRFQDLSPIM